MNLIRKASLGVVGLSLAFGGLSTVTTVAADAATPCAAQNQAKGAAQNEAAHKATHYRRTSRNLKRAKRAYRKHHTAANKKRLNRAKRANRRAYRDYRAANARYAAASAAASRCTAPAPTPSPATPATPDQIYNQFISLISNDALSQGAGQLADALRTAAASLAGTGLPLDQLQPVIAQLASAIQDGAADPSQIPAIAQQFADAIQGGLDPSTLAGLLGGGLDPSTLAGLLGGGLDPSAITGLLSGGLDPSQLASVLEQLSARAQQAGLPISSIITALEASAADFSSGHVPATPQDAVTYILEKVRQGAVGTPFQAQAAQLVDTLEGALGTLLGGLTGGGLPSIPGLPDLPTIPGLPIPGLPIPGLPGLPTLPTSGS